MASLDLRGRQQFETEFFFPGDIGPGTDEGQINLSLT
jgi:hypothetical protein